MKSPFIPPSVAKSAASPPLGHDWLHEVKFDGFRVQIHIAGGVATLLSRHGHDLTQRFSALRPALSEIAVNNAIVDAELVSCGKDGQPDFVDLMKRAGKADLCLWALDLLSLNGAVLLDKPLLERRRRLNDVINRTDDERILMSAAFDNPIRLLGVCELRGLEGIVSKRRHSTYQPGKSSGWLKIKTAAWREANVHRAELFKRTG